MINQLSRRDSRLESVFSGVSVAADQLDANLLGSRPMQLYPNLSMQWIARVIQSSISPVTEFINAAIVGNNRRTCTHLHSIGSRTDSK